MPRIIAWHRDVPHEEQRGRWVSIAINGAVERLVLGEPVEVSDKMYAFATEKIPVFAFGEVNSLGSFPRIIKSMTRFEVETL